MKELFIIGTYCDSDYKLKYLIECLNKIKDLNIDVLIYAKYPIPEHVQKMGTYYIYDSYNPRLSERGMAVWEIKYDRKFITITNDWGFAVMEQLIKSIGFAKTLNYSISYWINYDINLDMIKDFISVSKEKLLTHSLFAFPWKDTKNFNGKKMEIFRGIDLTAISLNINECETKLRGVINKKNYLNICKSTYLIPEEILFKMIEMCDLKYFIHDEYNYLPGMYDSMSEKRTVGKISDNFILTNLFFEKIFIGRDEDNHNNKIIYMCPKTLINEIVIDLGYGEIKINNFNTDKFNNFELNLHEIIPKKFKIISINDTLIGEEIDKIIDDIYFNDNKITKKY